MKTLIVFYSLEGNTELIAQTLAKRLQADTLKLETERPFPTEGFRKFFHGGGSVMFRQRPKLKNKNVDLNQYDLIIIGTPIWAGSYSSPIRSFITKYKIKDKNIALVLCSAGGEVEKCYTRLKKALQGNKFIGEIDFIEPLKKEKDEVIRITNRWAESLSI